MGESSIIDIIDCIGVFENDITAVSQRCEISCEKKRDDFVLAILFFI